MIAIDAPLLMACFNRDFRDNISALGQMGKSYRFCYQSSIFGIGFHCPKMNSKYTGVK